MASENSDPTTPRGALTDVFVSLILIAGVVGTEMLKNLVPPNSIPLLIIVALNVNQLTLVVYFVRSLMRALTKAADDFYDLTVAVAQGASWLSAVRGYVVSAVPKFTFNRTRKAVLRGIRTGIIIAILGALAFGVATAPLIPLLILLVIVVVLGLLIRPLHTRYGMFNAPGCFGNMLLLLLLIAIIMGVSVILPSDFFYSVLEFLFLRR